MLGMLGFKINPCFELIVYRKCSFYSLLTFELVTDKTTEANSACPSDQQTCVYLPKSKIYF